MWFIDIFFYDKVVINSIIVYVGVATAGWLQIKYLLILGWVLWLLF